MAVLSFTARADYPWDASDGASMIYPYSASSFAVREMNNVPADFARMLSGTINVRCAVETPGDDIRTVSAAVTGPEGGQSTYTVLAGAPGTLYPQSSGSLLTLGSVPLNGTYAVLSAPFTFVNDVYGPEVWNDAHFRISITSSTVMGADSNRVLVDDVWVDWNYDTTTPYRTAFINVGMGDPILHNKDAGYLLDHAMSPALLATIDHIVGATFTVTGYVAYTHVDDIHKMRPQWTDSARTLSLAGNTADPAGTVSNYGEVAPLTPTPTTRTYAFRYVNTTATPAQWGTTTVRQYSDFTLVGTEDYVGAQATIDDFMRYTIYYVPTADSRSGTILSALPNFSSAATGTLALPRDPQDLTVVQQGDDILLTWSTSALLNATHIDIHRRPGTDQTSFDPANHSTRLTRIAVGIGAYTDIDPGAGSWTYQVFSVVEGS